MSASFASNLVNKFLDSDLTIDISNELFVELETLAKDSGIDVDVYIQDVLEEEVLKNITLSLVKK
ncbi:hypothetical protein [Prochlorococcus marinus]|uniref:Uncharacterized protein n=1 Tax=Prochlorococcus marinus XMU1408 TaxID=2213228 RepID=A0A318R128_PROMR|nr:hypothetical protein [Prochlorococcus marinus]MBW3041848.1 hypothetical protein [Prochlorococcus marinus str. XMU1408]PYE02986.1 hypothetical protein DNJ73_04355 [Prochlorococcus marinus XMU1408]